MLLCASPNVPHPPKGAIRAVTRHIALTPPAASLSVVGLALPGGFDLRPLFSCPRYLQLLAAAQLIFGFTLQNFPTPDPQRTL